MTTSADFKMFAARMVKFCIEPVPTPAPTMNTLVSNFTNGAFEEEEGAGDGTGCLDVDDAGVAAPRRDGSGGGIPNGLSPPLLFFFLVFSPSFPSSFREEEDEDEDAKIASLLLRRSPPRPSPPDDHLDDSKEKSILVAVLLPLLFENAHRREDEEEEEEEKEQRALVKAISFPQNSCSRWIEKSEDRRRRKKVHFFNTLFNERRYT
jgi:hypothetical protein